MTTTTPAPGAGRIYTGHREAMTTRDWQALGWDAATAGRYAAAFVGSAVRVFVVDEHGARPLTHHVRHSPSGFAWGYGGSGAAELARCVLENSTNSQSSAESIRVEPSSRRAKIGAVSALWRYLVQNTRRRFSR